MRWAIGMGVVAVASAMGCAGGSGGGRPPYLGTFEYRYPDGLTILVKTTDNDTLYWECLEGEARGQSATEKCDRREVAPGVYFVNWIEKDGTAISQVVDYNRMTVVCNIVAGGQRFLSEGTLRRIE